ncbi:hypothetical protein D9619_006337 [Psilocybe cf. subviscida]|uniref:RanBP2-type domain-containing protein n=1 Tax=Psilocybe cf. subviscida TaxID=2480587 RepID=A0A8H5B3Q8_9AGAR|nr:hypothetical protein D9619_006337 [Psilocybe cf. subviscida]
MVLETIFNYLRGKKRTLAESDSDLPVDAEHVQGGSKRFRNAESHPQSADRIYTTSQPVLPASIRPPAAFPASSNAPPPPRSESAPIQHSKSLSSLDTNRRITIAPPTLAPSNFKFTYTASQTLPSSTTSAPATAPRPERKLKKNPNGPISYNGQWKSSSKKLNRHASPAFQVPARKPRAEAKDTYEVPADSKRRRVEGADPLPSGQAQASSSQSVSGSAAASQVTTTAPRASSISPPKPSTLSIPSSSRLRTPAKPTTPVRPSPLRQTWSSQPQPSPPHTQTTHLSPNHTQPTQTATFMAELITKTEPPRRNFDVSNPYQTANPVANAIPPRRATRRTKKPLDRGAIAAQKAKEVEKEAQKGGEKKEGKDKAEKDKDKAPYVSAQAQIEATLPPGSKRSRPPANLFSQTSSSPSSQTTSTVKSYIVEEVAEDSEDSSRSAKRSKPSLTSPASTATPKPSSILVSEPTIMDLDEVDNSSNDKGKGKQTAENATTTKPSTPTTPSPFGNVSRQPTLKSIPKEPSKLRNSFLPEAAAASPTSSAGAPSPPPIATAPLFTSFGAAAPTAPAAPSAAAASATDAPFSFLPPSQPPAPKIAPPSASSFTFKPTVPSPSQDRTKDDKDKDIMDTDVNDEDVKKRVRTMDEKALPTFDFVFSSPSVSSTTDTSREHVRGREDVKVLPVAALPSFAFNVDGAKPTWSSAPGGFKFDLPGPSSAGSSSKPFAFGNTAAAATSSNSAPAASASPFMSGSSKGNAPAPAAAAPAPAPTGFNWAAAGMKAPETKDKWLCAVCDVRNDNALKKCVACQSDRPGGAPVSSSSAPASTSLFGSAKPAPPAEASKPPAAPAVVGFDWAAAGMKAPDTSDKWVCAVCDVRNAQSAKKCVSCESDKPGAAAPSSSASTSTSSSALFGSSKPAPVEMPKPPAVVGFNWAAAGMKAPDTSDKWVCAVCDIRNAQAAKKCVSCESDKPGAVAPSSSSSSKPSLFGSSKPAPVEMPKPPAAPAVVGFNWAAAGMKAPDTSDKWTCAVCDVRNAQSATKCVSCESDKPGAAASSSSSKASSASTSLFGSYTPTPTPPAAPAVTAFNWAAAGMKAPDTSNKWTCTLCGLSNEQKAAQCETCETPR